MATLSSAFEGRHGHQITQEELQARSDFLPVLNPPRWHGARHAMARRLTADLQEQNGQARNATPWVALGLNVGNAFAYPPPESGDSAADFELMLPAALRHLVDRQDRPRWQLASDRDSDRILIRKGDDLTASDLLDTALLRQAGDLLQADEFMLGVPSRRVVIAFAHGEEAGAQPLISKCYEQARLKQGQPLTPEVFVCRGGRLERLTGREQVLPTPPAIATSSASQIATKAVATAATEAARAVAQETAQETGEAPTLAIARQRRHLLVALVALAGLLTILLAVMSLRGDRESLAGPGSAAIGPAPAQGLSPTQPPPTESASMVSPIVENNQAAPVTSNALIVEALQEDTMMGDGGPTAGVRLWRHRFAEPVRELTYAQAADTMMARFADHMLLLDLESRRQLRRFHGVFGIMSADGKAVATRGEQVKRINVWQTSDGQLLSTLELPPGEWQTIILVPGGRQFILFGEEIMAIEIGREKPLWRLYVDDVTHHALSPHGDRLAILRPGALTVLDNASGRTLASTRLETPLSGPVCFSSLSTVVAGDRGRALVMSEDLDIEHQVPLPPDSHLGAAAQGGEVLAIVTPHHVLLVSGREGRPLVRVPHNGSIDSLFLNDRDRLYTVTDGLLLTCWDVSSRR